MQLENAFEVPTPPKETLDALLDAERVVPCMPGAQLLEQVDERTWKAAMKVKLGPVGLDFANDVRIIEIDEEAGIVKMAVKGRDTRGKGAADADVVSRLVAIDGGGTRVEMSTDLRLSGQAAKFGRGSIVQDVSTQMVARFADCLRAELSGSPEQAEAQAEAAAKPISSIRLFFSALGSRLGRLFGRSKGGS
ncbi:MAG TPA: SRPBCC family protein [Miltoncostaeaceae bacterium]|nr:SRPBCC family protein [Miltoncostaeaceae bacterium]